MQAHEEQVTACTNQGHLLSSRVGNAHQLQAQLDDFNDKWRKTYNKIGTSICDVS